MNPALADVIEAAREVADMHSQMADPLHSQLERLYQALRIYDDEAAIPDD